MGKESRMAARKKPLPFAKRFLRLRRAKKMTLKQIANDTGMSAKYVSQIEKGEVIPPVAVILQLSRALEIDSGVLLNEEKRLAGKKKLDDYQKRTQDYAYQTLTTESQRKHLKAFKVLLEPKSDHEVGRYQHMGEEFIYVLKGRIEVMVGENKNVLGAGDSLHFNSSIMHKLRNVGAKEADLLVVLYTP
jgi:transcriptional regulator with XRE-family HTH domain